MTTILGKQRQTAKQTSCVLLKYILQIVKEFEDTKGVYQNAYIDEEQTKEKGQNNNLQHIHIKLKLGINISSCNLFPNPINYFLLCNVYNRIL